MRFTYPPYLMPQVILSMHIVFGVQLELESCRSLPSSDPPSELSTGVDVIVAVVSPTVQVARPTMDGDVDAVGTLDVTRLPGVASCRILLSGR